MSGDPNFPGHVFGLYKDTTAEDEELSPTFLRLFDDWNAREELALEEEDDDDDPDDASASTTPGARTDSFADVGKPAAANADPSSSATPASAASSSPSVEAALHTGGWLPRRVRRGQSRPRAPHPSGARRGHRLRPVRDARHLSQCRPRQRRQFRVGEGLLKTTSKIAGDCHS